jgi:hypothetical protein
VNLICRKKQSELLGSRLKGCNILHQVGEIRFLRKRQNEFKEFFSQENDLVYCTDVCSAIEDLGHKRDPIEWRLFIDSSQSSLKGCAST